MNALDGPIVVERLPEDSCLILKIDLRTGSQPNSNQCQIKAKNDIEAVQQWLSEYQYKSNTFKAYRREASRFLLWCSYVAGKTLAALKKEDFESYFMFLQNPPPGWCNEEKNEKHPKNTGARHLFKGKLSQSALMTAIRILNSMMNYLVQAEYLRANPIKLIKQYAKLSFQTQERKYKMWERLLETEEWAAVQQVLIEMPEGTKAQIENKMRTQFLFALLYFLGLRIHEVVNHTWANFRQKNGQWWFFVKGKGDKLGHIPVNQQLLECIKVYREYLNKPPMPTADDFGHLLVSQRTGKPLQITQLYSLVKAVGIKAAESFEDKPEAQEKLKAFSPHWLRHLAASHQDSLGMPVSMIKENLRHQSTQTTQLYVHSEDELRFTEMQKMQMIMQPKVILEKAQAQIIEYRLFLSKGPVNKAMGLKRLLAGIESQVFKGFDWVREGETEQQLLDKIKIQWKKLEIIYQLSTGSVLAAPQVWADALKRQAEIWLFECEVKVKAVERT